MAKTFEILSVDEGRSVLLIKFSDGNTFLETEIPFPPQLNLPDPNEDDLSEWIVAFWPHSVMERISIFPKLRTKVGLTKDITVKIPTPSKARNKVV